MGIHMASMLLLFGNGLHHSQKNQPIHRLQKECVSCGKINMLKSEVKETGEGTQCVSVCV
jgi:hypothetical protein